MRNASLKASSPGVLISYGAAGENFAGFCGREERFTGLQAPQAKILRLGAAVLIS